MSRSSNVAVPRYVVNRTLANNTTRVSFSVSDNQLNSNSNLVLIILFNHSQVKDSALTVQTDTVINTITMLI